MAVSVQLLVAFVLVFELSFAVMTHSWILSDTVCALLGGNVREAYMVAFPRYTGMVVNTTCSTGMMTGAGTGIHNARNG